MKKSRLRGDAVFAPDSRPSQHAFDQHMRKEYETEIQRTSSPPAEPMTEAARQGADSTVPADK